MFRHLFFLFWYRQWFRNHDGIKGFAQQCMNWLMDSTLSLADRLKKENKRLIEKAKEQYAQLKKCELSPVIEADEFPTLRGKIRGYNVVIWLCVFGETFFNFFAAKSIFRFEGYVAILLQVVIAVLITLIAIYAFEKLFSQVLREPKYKSTEKEAVNIRTLILMVILVAGYEYGVYYICKIRGIEIEGGSGTGDVATAMMIMGMIIPVFLGYYKYEKSRFVAPYDNTCKITSLRRSIAEKLNKIKVNEQRMESHFKRRCQHYWAYLQEFVTYKENYNRRKNIPQEALSGHFSEKEDAFILEAIERYKKKAVEEASEATVIEGPGEAAIKVEQEIREMFATTSQS